MYHTMLSPLVVALMLSTPAQAKNDTARCYSLKHDKRVACLSEAKKDVSGCASIRSHDKRQICSARASGKTTDCYSIRSKEDRNSCLAGMDW